MNDNTNPIDAQEREKLRKEIARSVYSDTINAYLYHDQRGAHGPPSIEDLPLRQLARECLNAADQFLKAVEEEYADE